MIIKREMGKVVKRKKTKSAHDLALEVQALFQTAVDRLYNEVMTTYECLRWFRT